MCMNCGCLNPTESHGDQRNITIDTLKKAGEANNMNLAEVLKNFVRTLPVVLKNWKNYSTV